METMIISIRGVLRVCLIITVSCSGGFSFPSSWHLGFSSYRGSVRSGKKSDKYAVKTDYVVCIFVRSLVGL